MLEKSSIAGRHYSIIAGQHRKNSVKLCTMGSKTLCSPFGWSQTTNQVKNFRSAEREYRLRSSGVIRIRISDPKSVWIMVHQRER